MNFGEIITALQNGKVVKRNVWGDCVCAVKQIDSDINSNVVPKMQSLPQDAKDFVLASDTKTIHYRSQCLRLKRYADGGVVATNYVPDWLDIFANDWEIVTD
ncbi:MW1434 family type I TA system toxin [Hoylesella buccalis]|uniref:Thoeris anti-defense Tad2 family protein n=1 Tax=Hoylesella buccalis TaxID=28127 RepID=UPI0006922069|nr:MW1434 family type I TA system toxin [Hoylesella buccalis]